MLWFQIQSKKYQHSGNFIMPLILNCVVLSFVIILLWDTLFLDFMLLFMSLKSMLIIAFQTQI